MKSNIRNTSTYIVLPIISFAVLSYVDVSSIFSYFYTLTLFLILNHLLCKGRNNNFIYFHYYLLFAVLLFIIHRHYIPNSLGLSGAKIGLGTDDCQYYAQLKDFHVPYPVTSALRRIYPFTHFLKFIYPFSITTPLNIVILNLLGITFLPYYTKLLANTITHQKQVGTYAEKLVLLCPFTTYYGCIIMRDMWIATLVIAGLYYFIKKKYILFLLFTVLIVYIRFGSIAFLGIGILILMRKNIYALCRNKTNGRILLLFLLGIVCVIFMMIFPYLQEYSGGKLEDGLFRASFYRKLSSMDSDAFILKLMQLPTPINYISLTTFFFFLPFINFGIYSYGIPNMMRIFCPLLTPVFFFFIWKYILKTILQNLSLKRNTPIKTIIYIAIAFSLCLGTISLQARHKTILIPILCILAAYGMQTQSRRFNTIASTLTLLIIGVEIYMAI